MLKKYRTPKKILITILLFILLLSFFSCQTITTKSDSNVKNIFESSIITSKNSNFNIYVYQKNQFIFEKSVNSAFILNLTQSYYNEIDPFLRLNNITKEKIRENNLRICLFKNIDNAFDTRDSIINYAFFDIINGKNVYSITSSSSYAISVNKGKSQLGSIKEMFKNYNFTGAFSPPNLIFIHLKKEKFEDKTAKDKFLLEAVLLHEYTHYLYQQALSKYLIQLIINSANGEDVDFEKLSNMQNYFTFINEAIAHLFSDYFEQNCFNVENNTDFKINEAKMLDLLKNKYKDKEILVEKKDPDIIVEEYNKHVEVRQYFFDFLLYLINIGGFENFMKFLNNLYVGDFADIDGLFINYFGCDFSDIFADWQNSK